MLSQAVPYITFRFKPEEKDRNMPVSCTNIRKYTNIATAIFCSIAD